MTWWRSCVGYEAKKKACVEGRAGLLFLTLMRELNDFEIQALLSKPSVVLQRAGLRWLGLIHKSWPTVKASRTSTSPTGRAAATASTSPIGRPAVKASRTSTSPTSVRSASATSPTSPTLVFGRGSPLALRNTSKRQSATAMPFSEEVGKLLKMFGKTRASSHNSFSSFEAKTHVSGGKRGTQIRALSGRIPKNTASRIRTNLPVLASLSYYCRFVCATAATLPPNARRFCSNTPRQS